MAGATPGSEAGYRGRLPGPSGIHTHELCHEASIRLAPTSPLAYAGLVGAWLRRTFGGKGGPGLRLSQSLGAFAGQEGTISPLYVFFEVTNTGPEDVEIARIYVSAKGDPRPVYEGPFEGDHALPFTLAPGESSRFHTRAKALAKALKEAGFVGRPRVGLVVEDTSGNRGEKVFPLRVDEYLRLKDE